MKLYVKQKVFSWGDRFRVYDEAERELYYVEGEVFSFGKKLHLYGMDGSELAYVRQKLFSFLPRFFITVNGADVAEVKKEFTFARPVYDVIGPDWKVTGNFWAHDYRITAEEKVVASVAKKWFTWGDTYEIDVSDDRDVLMALSVVLVIDAVLSLQQASASASSAASSSGH